jgi:uncharacterized protein (TIGR00299 family) protein
MNLAAMIDLGVDSQYVIHELSKLGLDEEFELLARRETKMGISGTKVTVQLRSDDASVHHSHRNIDDIKNIIINSSLAPKVQKTALDIFMEVARSEAIVHGKRVEEVHFHEVGATDSIVDIVGAAVCYHELDIDKVLAGPVELGSGIVKCSHGTMPVPAPATAEILKNCPVTIGGVQHEATTPTGAAIIKTLTDNFVFHTGFTILKTAYGMGQRDAVLPNVVRVFLGKLDELPSWPENK